MNPLLHKKHIHFIGIGGIGMSSLARLMNISGYVVTGSDSYCSAITEQLVLEGVAIQYDHEPHLVLNADVVVYSSAIASDNPERRAALNAKKTVVRRAAMLGQIMQSGFSVAIAGTHGKTTTTSLIAHVLDTAGKNPTAIVGGIIKSKGSNAVSGSGGLIVAEADEFDRSFLEMYPTIAVVTNIEAEHLDCYTDLDDIVTAFVEFVNHVPFYGCAVVCVDSPSVAACLDRMVPTLVTYGFSDKADFRADSVKVANGTTTFSVYKKNTMLGQCSLSIPGMHNIQNALAVIAVAYQMGVDFSTIAASCASFNGVKRRFDILGTKHGITVVDDYAHHPSEITATLQAAKSMFKRIVGIFQPHLYSRTRDFMFDFSAALMVCDVLIVTEIYRARGEVIPGISGQGIVDNAVKAGHRCARFVASKNDIPVLLASELIDGDGVVIMGAGDINDICPAIFKELA